MKIKSIASCQQMIQSTDWTFSVLSDKMYRSQIDKDSAAICYMDKKLVYICKAELTPATIMHELVHCLVSEMHLESANLDQSQFEEVMCELIATHYYKLGSWTHDIFGKLYK